MPLTRDESTFDRPRVWRSARAMISAETLTGSGRRRRIQGDKSPSLALQESSSGVKFRRALTRRWLTRLIHEKTPKRLRCEYPAASGLGIVLPDVFSSTLG